MYNKQPVKYGCSLKMCNNTAEEMKEKVSDTFRGIYICVSNLQILKF